MWEIRTRIIDFKKNLYDLYRQHIEELQSLSVNEIEDIVLPDENEIVGRIFTDVRETIQNEIAAEAAKRSEERKRTLSSSSKRTAKSRMKRRSRTGRRRSKSISCALRVFPPAPHATLCRVFPRHFP